MQDAFPTLSAAGLAGCAGPQSMLDPAGPAARDAALLWWPMLAVAALVLALVITLWLIAMRRSPRDRDNVQESRIIRRMLVGGGILLPSISVGTLLAFGIPAGERMLAPVAGPALRIEVTGHQWWWEVRYPDHGVTLANELHLPAGRPVDIHIGSADVIHSFWVPRLGRKLDAIPGRRSVLRVQADAAGTMRGQCSEYCGQGHAHMTLSVEVHSADAFAEWLARQPKAAP